MFDLLAKLLCSVATFAFPIFASYKALKANDPAQLTPWLMYWVVLACVLCVESWVEWAISWLPFYQDLRACFMLWLVLPQTQGATKLYFEYVHPTLTKHESDIEEFISRAHDQAKALGAEYIQRLIEVAKQILFGVPPQVAAANRPPSPPPPQDAASFAQALFSRWRVPPLTPYAPQMATEFYNFVSSALQTDHTGARGGIGGNGGSAAGSGSLIPPHVRTPADKARFIALQRQRLKKAMAALESEMETIEMSGETAEGDVSDTPEDSSTGNGGGLYKSFSQGHLSTYEGDFDHVEIPVEGEVGGKTPPSYGGWLFGWGGGSGKPATAAPGTAKAHQE